MKDVTKAGTLRVSNRHFGAPPWIEGLLLATGLSLLLIYLAAWIHGTVMYRVGLWNFVRLRSSASLNNENGSPAALAGIHLLPLPKNPIGTYAKALAEKIDTPIGVLSIRRLQLEVPVFDGTGRLTLNRGVGRIVGTAGLGEQGNSGIAGHRDGFFRKLKDVEVGDRIELATSGQEFVYIVEDVRVVSPDDTSILGARPRPSLTLVTCYPFYFVGDAPERYVVQASLTSSEGESSELNRTFPNTKHKEQTQ